MYVVMNFGVFVCSPCAGIHREMTHKVKGISMSNFSEDEIKTLTKLGNLNQQANLMAKWSDKRDCLPAKDDTWKMKDFFRNKYIDKKFASKKKSKDSSDDNSDDSEDSEEAERRRRKRRKEKKKAKEAAKAKAKHSYDSENEEEKTAENNQQKEVE